MSRICSNLGLLMSKQLTIGRRLGAQPTRNAPRGAADPKWRLAAQLNAIGSELANVHACACLGSNALIVCSAQLLSHKPFRMEHKPIGLLKRTNRQMEVLRWSRGTS